MGEPLWLDEHQVASLLDIGDAIEAVRSALLSQAAGTATPMPKSVLLLSSGGTLHALGGEMSDLEVIGTKTWCHTPGGAQPLLILYSPYDGKVQAIIEAFALGQLRTSATSAVATDLLALPDAQVLALVGTGRQAWAQVAAVAEVRTLTEVRVYGRDDERRRTMAAKISASLNVDARPVGTVDEAVSGAQIVTLVTRATEPILHDRSVGSGTHVNAIGAVTPERSEFHPGLLARCATVVTDSVEQARSLSSEFRAYFGDDEHRWASVAKLCDLVASEATRPPHADVTLFKALGLGLSDIGVGLLALRRAEAARKGHRLWPYRHADLTTAVLTSQEQQ